MTHTIVLIHGAGASGAAMAPLRDLLAPHVPVETPNWLSHGGRELAPVHSIPEIAVDILAQLEQRGIRKAVFFGYSLGGTIALYIARHFPHRVSGVASLAGKVHFPQQTIDHLVHLSQHERRERTDPDVTTRHLPQDWRAVTDRNREMFRQLLAHPPLFPIDMELAGKPAIVFSGEQDQIVPLAETTRIAGWLRARLRVFPGPAHPLTAVPLPVVVSSFLAWLKTVPE